MKSSTESKSRLFFKWDGNKSKKSFSLTHLKPEWHSFLYCSNSRGWHLVHMLTPTMIKGKVIDSLLMFITCQVLCRCRPHWSRRLTSPQSTGATTLASNTQQDLATEEANSSQEDQGVQAHLPFLSGNDDVLITIPALLRRPVDSAAGVDNITDKVPVRSVSRWHNREVQGQLK